MFLGRGTTSSVIHAAGSPRDGVRARPKTLVVLGEKERADSRVAGLFEQVQRAGDVGVDELLAGVRGHVRLVQSRGMDDGIHAAQAHFEEPAVHNRSNAMGESRRRDVEAEGLMTGER
jgi:hypothetical protein